MRAILGTAVAAAVLVPAAPAAAHAAPAKTQITFTISTTADGRFSLKGTLTASGVTVPAGKKLIIESGDEHGKNWRAMPPRVGKPPVTKAGGAFAGSYNEIGYPHGYYRVKFAGDSALAATTSKWVRDKRINTRVFGWKVTPRKIRKGSYVTFSGTLKHNPGTAYVPYKGRKVYVMGRIKGEKKWYWYVRPKTNAKGYFKARFKVYKDTYFSYVYPGDSTHYDDFPLKDVFVDVR